MVDGLVNDARHTAHAHNRVTTIVHHYVPLRIGLKIRNRVKLSKTSLLNSKINLLINPGLKVQNMRKRTEILKIWDFFEKWKREN